jgi:tetratricopeptide (TPR) repeat protein
MMNELLRQADELRQEAVRKIRANELEAALPLLDEALTLSDSDDVLHELITITKAGALISLEQNGPEVQALPMIIMRRRNLRNLYLAAYNLGGKYEIERDFKKAHQYDRIALEAAEAAGEIGWKTEVLIALGNICVYDSRIDEAMALYAQALSLLEPTAEQALRRGAATQNLGYCRLLKSETNEGIALILQAVELLEEAGAHGFLPECYIDLCYGYLDSNDLDRARFYGEKGLAEALETRQVRNAHFLLGEISYKQGDTPAADFHFEKLARFYPDFPHLKHLLHALDLRSMVNLKL